MIEETRCKKGRCCAHAAPVRALKGEVRIKVRQEASDPFCFKFRLELPNGQTFLFDQLTLITDHGNVTKS